MLGNILQSYFANPEATILLFLVVRTVVWVVPKDGMVHHSLLILLHPIQLVYDLLKIIVGERSLLAEQAQMFLEKAKMCRTAKKYLFLGGINVPAHKLGKNYGFQEYQTTESWLWGTTTTFLSYNSWSNYNWTKGKNTNLFFVILNNFFKVAISKLP